MTLHGISNWSTEFNRRAISSAPTPPRGDNLDTGPNLDTTLRQAR
jgi:hypothetical protein